MSKKFIDLANLKSNLENFLSEIISPTFATKEGVSEQLGNHTVKSDVPENAVFTDTIYDDTEVQKRISDNGYGEVAGGKNLWHLGNQTTSMNTFALNKQPFHLDAGTYTINYNSTASSQEFVFFDKDMTIINKTANKRLPFLLNKDCEYVSLYVNTGTVSDIQLEEGSVATEYEPYFPSNNMLAEENSQQSTEMMDIKMLGWSVPRECPIQNEVNGNQFIQKVGRVDLGSLNWRYDTTTGHERFRAGDNDTPYIKPAQANNALAKAYSNIYVVNSANGTYLHANDKSISIDSSSIIWVYDTSYTDATTFKTAMQGQYLYYELATYNTITIDGNEIGETVSDVRKETTVNLFKPPFGTATLNGVKFITNADSSVSISGAVESGNAYTTSVLVPVNIGQTYKVIGKFIGVYKKDNVNRILRTGVAGDTTPSTFTATEDFVNVCMYVSGNDTIPQTGVISYPMLTTNLDATYDDFVPYTGDTGKLNSDVAVIRGDVDNIEKEVSNVRREQTTNMLSIEPKTLTSNGITCRIYATGSCYLSGTATSDTTFKLWGSYFDGADYNYRKYKVVGAPKGASESTFCLQLTNKDAVNKIIGSDYGNGFTFIPSEDIIAPTPEPGLPPTGIGRSYVTILVKSGQTLKNVQFKPMVTTNLNATYDDFIPYTGDTGKLNSDVSDITRDVVMINSDVVDIKSIYSSNSVNLGRKTNSITGEKSSAFGESLIASGIYSHAEGYSTTASGESSHAEGKSTTASASYTHSEGVNTSAIGQGSHAEGSNLELSGSSVIFENPREVVIDDIHDSVIITVAGSQAFGLNSHAEGCSTLAYGKNSHTEGYHTFAQANESHAEGCGSEAGGTCAHAEGYETAASGDYSHAEGRSARATSYHSHAEGYQTTASGNSSHAEGYYTKAINYASHASGKYNAAMTTGGGSTNTTGTAFVIGNGTGSSALSNAFSVQYSGIVKAKSTITASTTADYAEFFEWLDKNPNEEDRVGHFVTLDGDKIKIATDEDDYILGIVSGEPFVLGNGDCDTWNGMYLHDEFRRTMYEPAPKMIEILDSEGNPTGEYKEVEGEYEGTRPVLNPDYDPTQEYISRFDRAEWSPVGMLGVLAVLHDGTAEVNGYVTVNNQGIATKCTRDTRNSYRVIKKVSDKVVEVIFK